MTPDAAPAVRRATAADLAEILHLISSCDEAPHWPETVWRDYVAIQTAGRGDRLLLLVQGVGQELEGLLAATFLAEQTELESLLVAREARRRGLGRAMVVEWLAWAEAKGATAAMLEVRASNTAALELYQGLAFVVKGRRTSYYRTPVEDAVLMRREMAPR